MIRRGDRPDSDWSDPGSTFGIPDRWQWRNLRGLHLTVGNNNRKKGGVEFIVPESASPWKVYAFKSNDRALGQLDLALVASGTAPSLDAARDAAERAALAWEEVVD